MSNSKRRCMKCREYFPQDSMVKLPVGWFCGMEHAMGYAADRRSKAKDKESKNEWTERKKSVKPIKHWEDMTQRVVNNYITKVRDVNEPCISCGTYETVQWEAGHYRSRGAASHLRYNEDNIHKQCHRCNAELSSNAIPYRAALVLKIGTERVEELENNNTPHRYTREELEGMRATYRAKLRLSNKPQESA